MFNFEKLDVWNEAIAFADSVYTVTRAFPQDERFGLTNQLRREGQFPWVVLWPTHQVLRAP